MERENRYSRVKKGALVGGLTGLGLTAGATVLTLISHHAELLKESARNQSEILNTVGTLIILYSLGSAVAGAMLEGYVFPEIDRIGANLRSWVEDRINKL